MINIGKREGLYIVVHGLAEISCQTGTCTRGKKAAQYAGCQSQQSHHDHHGARANDIVHVSRHNSAVHDPSHQDRDDHLADDFTDHTDRREQRYQAEFPDLCQYRSDHQKPLLQSSRCCCHDTAAAAPVISPQLFKFKTRLRIPCDKSSGPACGYLRDEE